MKISLNWLKDYLKIDISESELSEILTNLGLEVEGQETIESIKGGFRGLVVGEVTSCVKHPNADKLSLTTVNIGFEEDLQIVCGAPNVAQGQKVIVASVGTELHPSNGDSFRIKKGKIRGEVSEGMICAEDEIGIGTDHDGIIVLPENTVIGALASDVYQVTYDTVFDIGLTPNRSDATAHLGVAEDLVAYFNFHRDQRLKLNYPSVYEQTTEGLAENVSVNLIEPRSCPRYSGICLSNIKIGPAPDWIQERLKAVDVRPINNVVDITNYVLHEFGQPLHAFDLRAISDNTINVKYLPEGSKFVSLDEVDRKLSKSDLMICDGNDNGMCIGGVFGGIKSGVKDDTDAIFLESAHFEPQGIRKTSTYHNLRTDAAKCFEKGSDPNITVRALMRAVYLLQEYAEAKVSSQLVDIYPSEIIPKEIEVRRSKINKLIGNDLTHEDFKNIFNSLSFSPFSGDEENYTVQIPTNKADVTREVDVAEEVLRIYGYNNVITTNRINAAIQVAEPIDLGNMRNALGNRLIGKGYHEIMGLSLVTADQLDNLGLVHKNAVWINNTSNIDLNVMRPDMLSSMLTTVAYNFNRQQQDLRLFEFGKTYRKEEDYKEIEYLSIIQTGVVESKGWQGNDETASFYSLKRLVNEIFENCGMTKYQVSELDDIRFTIGMKYHHGQNVIASFGLVSDKFRETAGIKHEVWYAEISVKSLLSKLKKTQIKVEDISNYPESKRDLALIIPNEIRYKDLESLIRKTGKTISNINLFDVYRDAENIGSNKKSYAISMTFVSHEKSLSDKDINKTINKIIEAAKRQFRAELR